MAKGSKLEMQKITNTVTEKNKLDLKLNDTLTWLSPLANQKFKEYQLSSLASQLGIPNGSFSFWPQRQPQWDGIAIGEKGTLYLFEGKSHLGETKSTLKSTNNVNKTLITNTFNSYWQQYKITDNTIQQHWLKGNYQIANRIVFLNEIKKINKNVKLVFLNFVNDPYWLPKNKAVVNGTDWDNHYDGIFKSMDINNNTTDIIILKYDCAQEQFL